MFVAAGRGAYSWSDSAGLLSDLADDRLRQIDTESDEHRAAAVALALLTTVRDGEELATLAGAVTALPPEPHRLDVLLEDLADAGLAAGPPYTMSPDAIAPVLAAAALDPHARVKIKLFRALKTLGRAASWTPPDDSGPDDGGLLGIAPLLPDSRARVLGVHTTMLAAQLSVLAQAAYQRGDNLSLATLRKAVRELLPGEADLGNWLDVITLAGEVAPMVPRLLGELREELVRQWPQAATTDVWDDDPAQRYRFDTERLLIQAVSAAEQVGRTDPTRAVSWALECVWLSYPVLNVPGLASAERAIRSLIRVDLRASAQTWDHVFERRRQVLDAVRRWGRDRCAGPPAGLTAHEHDVRDPAVAAHVFLTALTPFLSLVTEDHALRTPGNADAYTWTHYALPDDPRATRMLTAAADAVSTILGRLDLRAPAARPVLQAIARLPQKLRAETAQGLGDDQPLPGYAGEMLNTAADRISRTLASRWDDLPLMIRYAAAESAARAGGRPASTLPDLAAGGDPVATAALADTELERLLVVLPVGQNLHRITRSGGDAGLVQEQHQQRARQLGEQLPVSDVIELLELIDAPPTGTFGPQCLAAFAEAAGRSAPSAEEILTRLAASPFYSAAPLLAGLLRAHSDAVLEWLSTKISVHHVAELAVWIADQLPPDQEAALLNAVAGAVTGTTTLPDRPPDRATLPTGPDATSGPENVTVAGRIQLACQLARHLGQCRLAVRDRLARLVALGMNGPVAALPAVLAAADQVLHSAPAEITGPAPADRALRCNLVGTLGRGLVTSDGTCTADIDYDVACAGASLARSAPDEVADLLIERALTAPALVIPFQLHDMLVQMPADERAPVALAFQERAEQQQGADALTGRPGEAILDTFSLLGVGTASWAALVRRWAAGNADDRVRAAMAIRRCWRNPVWQDVVPGLIDAGLNKDATSQLTGGLLPDSIGPELDNDLRPRLAALQPLLSDARPAVREFAAGAVQLLNAQRDLQPWPNLPGRSRSSLR